MNSTVELQDGKVEIDGLDISQIELNVLRNRLALVPQDATLFLGTLRDNLYDSFYLTSFLLINCRCRDPQRLRTDAEVIAVLQRAWLLPKDGPVDPAVEAKFSLDSIVGDEGLCDISRLSSYITQ
jgi:ATP-binding cassette subfamily C (CFTR/MRP) protein 1